MKWGEKMKKIFNKIKKIILIFVGFISMPFKSIFAGNIIEPSDIPAQPALYGPPPSEVYNGENRIIISSILFVAAVILGLITIINKKLSKKTRKILIISIIVLLIILLIYNIGIIFLLIMNMHQKIIENRTIIF